MAVTLMIMCTNHVLYAHDICILLPPASAMQALSDICYMSLVLTMTSYLQICPRFVQGITKKLCDPMVNIHGAKCDVLSAVLNPPLRKASLSNFVLHFWNNIFGNQKNFSWTFRTYKSTVTIHLKYRFIL